MKLTLQQIAFLLLQGLHHAEGHYGYPFTVVDGEMSERWEFVRPTTEFSPIYDYSGIDAMCGYNGGLPMFPVKTQTVAAGSTFGFASAYAGNYPENEYFGPYEPDFNIYHDGPATAYLSRAPDDVDLNDYAGDGDWFKIAAIGASDGVHWDVSNDNPTKLINFTIPESTPAGKYLLRAEHINMSKFYKTSQLFVNCAHIEITGSGTGTPGPVTHFPGAFDAKDTGIWLPAALWKPEKPMDELKNWQGAGPAVWTG